MYAKEPTMTLQKWRRWRRAKMREKLESYAIAGRKIAHLPPWLDREPRHDLHRALRAAFMRGFISEQKVLAQCA